MKAGARSGTMSRCLLMSNERKIRRKCYSCYSFFFERSNKRSNTKNRINISKIGCCYSFYSFFKNISI